jgi:hypothetical protein
MKAQIRQSLAREPFEKKIAKTEQLIRLAKEFPRRQTSAGNKGDLAREEAVISAIRDRTVLEFVYNDQPRIVEPQTYGISIAVIRFCADINGVAVVVLATRRVFDFSRSRRCRGYG